MANDVRSSINSQFTAKHGTPAGTMVGLSRSGCTTVECLDHERPFQARITDKKVCADIRCIQDPGYFEIEYVKNRFDLKGIVLVPGLLKRCDVDTRRLLFVDNDEPKISLVKEYTFAVPALYAEALLPSRLYKSVWDERTRRRYAEAVFPKSSSDLPIEMVGAGKMRVGIDGFAGLLDFCRFSIHTHVGTSKTVCCDPPCCRPEPLSSVELSAIRSVARYEPYYTCSWLEKRVLFKWHVNRECFEPYLLFDRAIGVYNDVHNRMDVHKFMLFAFENWKTPEKGVTNADLVYFHSPTNLAGYKWYEPTARDDENNERYGSDRRRIGTADTVSARIAAEVMNLAVLPENVLLASALVKPVSIKDGVDIGSLRSHRRTSE